MRKHYIRIDANNNIIKTFSNAFEEPEAGDILYKEDIGEGLARHFNLELKDPLTEFYRYKYDSKAKDVAIEKTEKEIFDKQGLLDYKDKRKKIMKRKAYYELVETDWKTFRHKDQIANSESAKLTDSEYLALLHERKIVRDKCDSKELMIDKASTKTEVDAVKWN